MTNVDSQRIKEIRDNTRAMAEAFGRIADVLAEALELYVSTQTETQNSNLTFEKADERCKGCKHYKLTCDLFSEICKYEPKDEPQTEDLQDWKDRMWAEAIVIEPITEDCSMISCLKCEHNEQCHYLVKDIPWPDCPWKRRYEYNRLCSIING